MTQEEIQQVVAALEKKYVLIPKKRSIEAYENNAEVQDMIITEVINVACAHYGIEFSDLNTRRTVSGKWDAPGIRGLIAMVIRSGLNTRISTGKIGARLHGRDHATIIHNIQRVSDLMDIDYSKHRDKLYRRAVNPWVEDYNAILAKAKSRIDEILLVE